jgi:FAD:protein FMN transferase
MHTEMTFRTAAPWQPLERRVVNGPTMGTRFSAVFYAPVAADLDAIGRALQASVAEVDDQMSTWKPESDLMRFNRAEVGEWIALPPRLLAVMAAGLDIGRASDGAFDIGVLDVVAAYGFGAHGCLPDAEAVERITVTPRRPAHECIEIDLAGGRTVKRAPISIDLSGIAKGYGVDRLAETLSGFGISHYLVSIDGELRASGGRADGSPWRVAVEQPDPEKRDVAGVVEITDGALATSGNYRHRRELDGRSFAHTMDPRTGLPVDDAVFSATVRAATCMEADAWATVVLVLGEERAAPLLCARDLQAMVICPEAA